MIRANLLTGIVLALALPSALPAQTQLSDRWPLLSFARDGACELTITGTSRALQLRASGLIPGEALRIALTNGDMQPVQFAAFADRYGQLQRYYFPFRLNRDGGSVAVTLGAARCALAAAAPWTRGVHTIP